MLLAAELAQWAFSLYGPLQKTALMSSAQMALAGAVHLRLGEEREREREKAEDSYSALYLIRR